MSSLRQNITVHHIFFLNSHYRKGGRKPSHCQKSEIESHIIFIKTGLEALTSLQQSNKSSKIIRTKNLFVFGSYRAPLEVTENPRLPLHTRASTDLSGIWKYHPSSQKFRLSQKSLLLPDEASLDRTLSYLWKSALFHDPHQSVLGRNNHRVL